MAFQVWGADVTRKFDLTRPIAAAHNWRRAVVNLTALVCLMVLLAACVAANTVALEPQNRSLDGAKRVFILFGRRMLWPVS
jgi:hypothetical protein